MIWHREPGGRGLEWVPKAGDHIEINMAGQQVEGIVLDVVNNRFVKYLPIWNCPFNSREKWDVRTVSLKVVAYLPTPEAIAEECSRFDKLPQDDESGILNRRDPVMCHFRPIPKEWLRIAKRLAGIRDD